jgi:hypothetical protein
VYQIIPAIGGRNYLVYNNDTDTLVRALLERVLYVRGGASPPVPTKNIFLTLSGFAGSVVKRIGFVPVITADEFASSYSGRKKIIYTEAAESLATETLTPSKDRKVKHFVKSEKQECLLKEDPVPRVIQPYPPRYNVSIGVFLKPLEHRLYQAIDSMFGSVNKTVFKGMTVQKMGEEMRSKWMRFENPIAVGLDASRFDQHVSKDALEWEFGVYNSVFRSRVLEALMRWQLVTTGASKTTNGYVRLKHQGGRASGVMNTACGNVLIMCAMIWQYLSEIGLDAELVNNGDDCVLIFEKNQLNKLVGLTDWFLKYGFTMVVEDPVDVFERIVFCQMQPVLVHGVWTMVRNPFSVLDKDTLTLKTLNGRLYERMLATIGKGGVALNSGVPILQSFYVSLIDASNGAEILENDPTLVGALFMLGSRYKVAREVLEESRVSMYRAFGILPDHQLDLEKYFAETKIHFNEPSLAHGLILANSHLEWN